MTFFTSFAMTFHYAITLLWENKHHDDNTVTVEKIFKIHMYEKNKKSKW